MIEAPPLRGERDDPVRRDRVPFPHPAHGGDERFGSKDHPRAATVAFVEIREWRFLKPIFFGDTLHVVNEVVEKHSSGRRRGRVIWKRSLLNQDEETVQEGYLETVVELKR